MPEPSTETLVDALLVALQKSEGSLSDNPDVRTLADQVSARLRRPLPSVTTPQIADSALTACAALMVQEKETTVENEMDAALRRTEHALDVSNGLLRAINKAQSSAIAEQPIRRTLQTLLDDLLSMTHSEQGFIAEVVEHDSGRYGLKVHAATGVAWMPAMARAATETADGLTDWDILDAAIGVAMRDHHTAVAGTGKPSGDMDSFETLTGLWSAAIVPLMSNTHLVGLVGLINRPESFDAALVESIQPLMFTCGTLLHAHRNAVLRRRAEREQKSAEQRYTQFFDHNLDAAILGALDGRIFAANEAAENLFGFSATELCTQGRESIMESIAPLNEKALKQWRELGHFRGEVTLRRSDGSTFPGEISCTSYRTAGRIERTILTARDISDRKRNEAELLAAKEHAELANQAKTRFLANMSHELRTPLNAILGFSDVMRTQLFGPLGHDRYLGYADDIYDSGSLLLQIISDILDIVRIEAERLDLHKEDVDLRELIANAARLIQPRAVAGEVKLTVILPESDLPPLMGDRRLLKQALLNLLTNAVKFTPAKGEVTVSVHAMAEAVSITVSDTGIGIRPENLQKVFEPFERGEGHLTRRYEGAGLGLPLARAFVQKHGGTLGLESAPGKGTKATITLPIASAAKDTGKETQAA